MFLEGFELLSLTLIKVNLLDGSRPSISIKIDNVLNSLWADLSNYVVTINGKGLEHLGWRDCGINLPFISDNTHDELGVVKTIERREMKWEDGEMTDFVEPLCRRNVTTIYEA